MIKKKTVSVLFAAIMMIGFSLSSAHAGGLWCHAGTVVKAGVWESIANETRSGYNISVNCTLNDGDWEGTYSFFFIPQGADAGYATALTALTTGQTVEVKVTGLNLQSLMDRIYLNAAQ